MRRPLLLLCVCLFVLTALGMQSMNPPPWDSEITVSAGEEVFVVGQVYKKEYKKIFEEETIIFYLNVINYSNEAEASYQEIYQKLNKETSPKSIKVICEMNMSELPWRTEERVFVPYLGETILLQGQWQAFSHATNQGEFDYADFYAIEGIAGKVKGTQLLLSDQKQWHVREMLFYIRQKLLRNLYDAFEQKEAALLAKMLLGDGSGLDKEVRDLYQDNGIVHILSISGLHISMIGMGIYRLLRKCNCPMRVSAVFGATFIVLYGMMTGFGVSACRAIGMYLIHMLGELWGKTYDMLTAMGVLAVMLVVKNPRLVYHSGYLLSFASVCGVGLLAPVLRAGAGASVSRVGSTGAEEHGGRAGGLLVRLLGNRRGDADAGASAGRAESIRTRLLGNSSGDMQAGVLLIRPYDPIYIKWLKKRGIQIWNGFIVSLSVTLFTLPIQLFFFYKIPVYSVFINLLVIPFMSIVMIIGFVVMLLPGLFFLCPVESLIFAWFEWLCYMFQQLPGHTWVTGRPQMWKILLYYAVLMVLVCLGKRMKRLVIFCTLVAMVCFVGIRGDRETQITFLDVGQGDCICVQTASGECYLFDGGSSSQTNVGEKIIIPYLQFCGISKVDAIFVSHPDQDHMNGLKALLTGEEIEVERLILPQVTDAEEEFEELLTVAADAAKFEIVSTATEEKRMVEYVSRGDVLETEEYRITCLHPPKNYEADNNAYSACYLLEVEGISVLFTGDVEASGEDDFAKALKLRGSNAVDVLKVAHHGSRYSTTESFLDVVDSTLAIISCGKNNLYGHPHEETLERLAEDGSVIWSTAERGQITIEITQEGAVKAWSVVSPDRKREK